VGAVGAIVLLKGLLREAVEGECGCGAFETRGGDVPGAVGAAPSGEVVAFDPDQAFVLTSLPFACVWDSSSGATGGTRQCIERGRWTPARRRRLFSTELRAGKVTKGLRPNGGWQVADFAEVGPGFSPNPVRDSSGTGVHPDHNAELPIKFPIVKKDYFLVECLCLCHAENRGSDTGAPQQ
jgi:hypothetical protein